MREGRNFEGRGGLVLIRRERGSAGGGFQQRDIQRVEVFITLADFDVGRLGESGRKKKGGVGERF